MMGSDFPLLSLWLASPGAGSSKRSYSPTLLREMPEAKKAKAAQLSRPSALPNFAAPFEWPELVALVSEFDEYTHDVQRRIAGPSFDGDVEDITASITRIGMCPSMHDVSLTFSQHCLHLFHYSLQDGHWNPKSVYRTPRPTVTMT